jgi:hypothetical protein
MGERAGRGGRKGRGGWNEVGFWEEGGIEEAERGGIGLDWEGLVEEGRGLTGDWGSGRGLKGEAERGLTEETWMGLKEEDGKGLMGESGLGLTEELGGGLTGDSGMGLTEELRGGLKEGTGRGLTEEVGKKCLRGAWYRISGRALGVCESPWVTSWLEEGIKITSTVVPAPSFGLIEEFVGLGMGSQLSYSSLVLSRPIDGEPILEIFCLQVEGTEVVGLDRENEEGALLLSLNPDPEELFDSEELESESESLSPEESETRSWIGLIGEVIIGTSSSEGSSEGSVEEALPFVAPDAVV